MLQGIEFNEKKFDKENCNNLFCDLTNNVIVLCPNFDMKQELAQEIMATVNNGQQEIVATVNGKIEGNFYAFYEDKPEKAVYGTNMFLQTIIEIGDQKIYLCLEPAMVYKAKQIEDIWLLDKKKAEDGYLYTLIPFRFYKNAKNLWEKGLDYVYRNIHLGRYGGYSGEWIEDERSHTIWV